MIETELRSLIIEDVERLKYDVAEFLKERTKNKYTGYDSGIVCPKCKSCNTHICDSRAVNLFGTTHKRRYRECKNCKRRWSTIEIME